MAVLKDQEETMTTIKELCERYALSQTALARRFEIPLRTVQDWHSGRRTPPGYVVSMMEEILQYEFSLRTELNGKVEKYTDLVIID